MISIIISTLNEEEGIAKVLCSIPKNIWATSEVIVVDVSDDLTPIIAERLGAKVIKTARKGKGWQMRYAAKRSKGDILVFLDGDGTDPAEYIPKVVEKLKTCDLVLACRSNKKFEEDSLIMRSIYKFSRIFLIPPYRLLNLKVSDPIAGFRAIRKKDWERLDLKSDNFGIETEINLKAIKLGFKIGEVNIPNLKRCGGVLRSKFLTSPRAWLMIPSAFLRYWRQRNKK